MITVVIPTIGRPSLRATLAALGPGIPVVVVDDRPAGAPLGELPAGVRVVRSGGRGPAAARNTGWRAAATPWVAFLDDDVVPGPGWAETVRADLAELPEDVAGSQGRIVVPLPRDRRPTDAERHTAGLAGAHWPTADMAYRRSALERAGGFDERFFLYAEETDWSYRAVRAGWRHAVVPDARALHLGGATSTDPTRRETHFHASQERYLRKHHGAAGWAVARVGAVLGAAARSVALRGEARESARRRLRLYVTGPVRAESAL